MLEQRAHALERTLEGQVGSLFSSHHALPPESPTQGVLQAHPVIKRQIEYDQSMALGGGPAGMPEGTQTQIEQQPNEGLLALWNWETGGLMWN